MSASMIRRRFARVAAFALLLAGGCGADDASSPEPTGTSTASDCDAPPPKDVAALEDQVEATVDRATASFESVAEMTMEVEGRSFEVSTERTGSFSDDTFEGSGTLSFAADDLALAAAFDLPSEEQPFAFRLVDETFWFFNPVPDEPGWLGTNVMEFAQSAGGDPTVNIDGDAWISLVVESTSSVGDVVVDPETCDVVWAVTFSADDVAPLATTGGALRRLLPDGASTGEDGDGTVTVDEEGMVIAMNLNLDRWIRAASEDLVGAAGDAATRMQVSFKLGEFDQPLEVDAPCDDPIDHVEEGQPASLLCPDA